MQDLVKISKAYASENRSDMRIESFEKKMTLNFKNQARIKIGNNSYKLSSLLDMSMINASSSIRTQESAIEHQSPITV